MLFSFIRNFLRDSQVASVAPSSKYTVEKICSSVDFSSAKLVLEYGPGTGVFTRAILARLPADARLVAFETHQSFVTELRKAIPDRRLTVLHSNAADVGLELARLGLSGADYAISGIPFSFIPPEIKREIIYQTAEVLHDEGEFITYQVLPFNFPADRHLRDYLTDYFSLSETSYEFRNVPPLRIYRCLKLLRLQRAMAGG